MKTITIKNLILQFESHDDLINEQVVKRFIDILNEKLAHEFPDFCPAIMHQKMRPEDIESHPLFKEDEDNGFMKHPIEDDEGMESSILQHRVNWWYHDEHITELPESEEEHIRKMIEDGYHEGELVYEDETHDTTGWWKIIS